MEKMDSSSDEGVINMEKKKAEKMKRTLTSTQEVTYQHEFKMADRAGGYSKKTIR